MQNCITDCTYQEYPTSKTSDLARLTRGAVPVEICIPADSTLIMPPGGAIMAFSRTISRITSATQSSLTISSGRTHALAIFPAHPEMLTLSSMTEVATVNGQITLQTSEVVLKALAAAPASRIG